MRNMDTEIYTALETARYIYDDDSDSHTGDNVRVVIQDLTKEEKIVARVLMQQYVMPGVQVWIDEKKNELVVEYEPA